SDEHALHVGDQIAGHRKCFVGSVALYRMAPRSDGDSYQGHKLDGRLALHRAVLPAPAKFAAPDTTAKRGRNAFRRWAASAAQADPTDGIKITRRSAGPPKPLIIDVAQALGASPRSPLTVAFQKSRNMAFCLASRNKSVADPNLRECI